MDSIVEVGGLAEISYLNFLSNQETSVSFSPCCCYALLLIHSWDPEFCLFVYSINVCCVAVAPNLIFCCKFKCRNQVDFIALLKSLLLCTNRLCPNVHGWVVELIGQARIPYNLPPQCNAIDYSSCN